MRERKNFNYGGSRTAEGNSKKRSKAYRRAHTYLKALTKTLPDDASLEREAQLYFERYSRYRLDPFIDTPAKRKRWVKKTLGDGEGWAARLLTEIKEPHAYTLHAKHLRLPPECGDPANFYSRENRDHWAQAIRRSFAPPLHWKLELGERVHVHITADQDACLLHLPRGGELIKPIHNYEGWLYYLAKPSAPWNARTLALYQRAKRRGHLPQLSGTWGVPNRKHFHQKAA